MKKTSFLKFLLIPVAMAFAGLSSVKAEEPSNKICPIMTEDDADAEIKVSYQGKDIFFCCSPCVKQFKKEPDYYVAVFQEQKSVPAVQDLKVAGDVKLLEQRFCPFSTKRIVGPSCPTVDYKGTKVYLSKPGHVKTWEADPDKYAKEAFDKGLLPQLKGKI